ncbi:MAG: hypothetical protein AAB965_02545 [Patescibacteria group bacterium]
MTRKKKIYLTINSILIVLFWFWLVFQYLHRLENSISVIASRPNISQVSNNINKELFKGGIFSGEFTSNFPNMGIIAIRFKTYYRINDDRLIFRLKEKSSANWYYVNIYNTDQFQPDQLFPFGFPIIKESIGKEYYFEIESTKGDVYDAVSVSPIEPVYVSKHKFVLNKLVNNQREGINYVIGKSISLITDMDFVVHAILYLLVALSLMIYVIFSYNHPYPSIIIIALTSILVDIFLGRTTLFQYLLMAAWIVVCILLRLSSVILTRLTIVLLAISSLLFIAQNKEWSDKAAVWFYLILALIIIRSLLEDSWLKQSKSMRIPD